MKPVNKHDYCLMFICKIRIPANFGSKCSPIKLGPKSIGKRRGGEIIAKTTTKTKTKPKQETNKKQNKTNKQNKTKQTNNREMLKKFQQII